MRITVELSLYPLKDQSIPMIEDFIDRLGVDECVEVVTNQMSTQLRGDFDAVMRVVEAALRRSFTSPNTQVLVAKYINADLPIADMPEL